MRFEPPTPVEAPGAVAVAAPFDRVWDTVIDFFAKAVIPIETIDRSSGLIVASLSTIPPRTFDCVPRGRFERLFTEGVKAFAELGVNVPPACRLENARRLLTRVEGKDLQNRDPVLLRRVINANRLAFEVYVIVTAAAKLGVDSDSPFPLSRLNEMAWGSDDPSTKKPKGYSSQFELYVAALFVLSGVPVRSHDADLTLKLGTEELLVACKRMV